MAWKRVQVSGSVTTSPPTGGSATQVQGTSAAGAGPVGNPVQLGALDETSLMRALTMTVTGADAANNIYSGINTTSFRMGFNGTTWDMLRIPKVFKPQNAVAVNPEATVWTPAVGKKFRLMGVMMSGSVAGNYIFKDNTAGITILVVPSGAGGSGVFLWFGNGILSAAANNVLTCTGPAASTLSGTLFGTEE